MKKGIFDSYVSKVVTLFAITKEELFAKSKRRDLVDARHLLYYLCYHRPMQIRYIQNYMAENGYTVGHSSIIHGINQVSDKTTEDKDYENVCQSLT